MHIVNRGARMHGLSGWSVLYFGAALVLWLAASLAHAQGWPLSQLLAAPGTALDLTENGVKVDTIRKAWVERLDRVARQLGTTYRAPAPERFLARQAGGPNAFVTLRRDGRPILVMNLAMLHMVGDDDDKMAVVVGHELGHIEAHHLKNGPERDAMVTFLAILAGATVDSVEAYKGRDTHGAGQQLAAVSARLVNAKFSRDQEREADELGLRHMTAAGYDPSAAPRFWRQMEATFNGGDGLWLSSHPSSEERLQNMAALARTLQPVARVSPSAPATPPDLVEAASPPAIPSPAWARATPGDSAAPQYRLPAVADTFPLSNYPDYAIRKSEPASPTLETYKRGVAKINAKDFVGGCQDLEAGAQSDDDRILTQLGHCYLTGKGGSVNYARAQMFYRRAAAHGFTPAIAALGQMAYAGQGGPRDVSAALRYAVIAHHRGNPHATALLAQMISEGAGLPKDLAVARLYAEQAAKTGDLLGKTVLGVYLRDGVGGPVDEFTGFGLLKDAADSGYGPALLQLGIAYERGAGTGVDRDRAIALYRAAANSGVPDARDRLKALGVSD